MSMQVDKFNFSVLIHPARDVPGQWIAHVLELDVVTQGNSVAHVFDMVEEAAKMVCAENERTAWVRAPEDDWLRFYEIMNDGTSFEEAAEVPPGAWVAAIVEVVVSTPKASRQHAVVPVKRSGQPLAA